MKFKLMFFCLLAFSLLSGRAEGATDVYSPNGKLKVSLSKQLGDKGVFTLSVMYLNQGKSTLLIPAICLGLEREDTSFYEQLELVKVDKQKMIKEQYTALHGKRKERSNEAYETTFHLKNPQGAKLDVVVRAYNDGVCFRYAFPDKAGQQFCMLDERTSYQMGAHADRWLQPFVTSYEGPFPHQKEVTVQGEWGYPALFKSSNDSCWALITEANIDRNYCATKLSNMNEQQVYKLTFPSPSDGNGVGDVQPRFSLPWASPWRVVIVGSLSDVVESTLVEDVSDPCLLRDKDWIRPGTAAWIYWAYNHGTRDFKKVCEYIDLAASMNWEYMLIDWEWDQMTNGGGLEDAVKYARTKGVKPLIWYNSGGAHNRVMSTPRDRLISAEARNKEFAWLKSIGIYGIKVDFFESDKQNMMNYYIDLLEDAAKYQLMINFHGCTVPRGWSRTYPHLMSMEAIYGAEQYNNSPTMTVKGAEWNTVFPFTRNVVGPMDYTPVAFTNSQHPHTTTYVHELALSVIFESGIQHWADRPSGFYNLPDAAKEHLRHIPTAWDDTRLIAGYPGKQIVLARRKGDYWHIAGINGTNRGGEMTMKLDFLSGKAYKMTVIKDSDHDTGMEIEDRAVRKGEQISMSWLPRGGFVVRLAPL